MTELPASVRAHPDLDLWIHLEVDGTVRLHTGRVELGQGIASAIARIGAEELDVALERIRVVGADTAHGLDEGLTAGSTSLSVSGSAMRQVAAEARLHLLELAAARLGVAIEGLRVDDGTVTDDASGASTSYWELMGGRRFGRAVTGRAKPKQATDHRVLGRPGQRIDLEGLVTGTTRFVGDLVRRGMLHGRIVRPPSPGARIRSVDDAPVRSLAGVVTVVTDGSFLGVAAEREEQAIKAANALRTRARWDEQPTLPDPASLHAWLRSEPAQSFRVVDGTPVEGPIAPEETPGEAVTTLRATYTKPFLMHASIGPSAAMAEWVDSRVTIWTHSQGVYFLRSALAAELGLELDGVRVIHVVGPGCYGHNGADDVALDAALLGQHTPGRPVLVKWSRADEHAWEPYGPPMLVTIKASLDDRHNLVSWSQDAWGMTHSMRPIRSGARRLLGASHRAGADAPPPPSPQLVAEAGIHRNATPIYAIARQRIVKHMVDATPLRTSALRSLGAYANVFAIESFMDEAAHAAGSDPLDFRLRHLDDDRASAVLQAAADRAGWRPSDPSREFGRGRGLAFARYKNAAAYCAVVLDVRVEDPSAEIVVERAVIAADAGEIVDPSGLANQLEGGLIQAASWTLKERVTFDDTRVESVDWESYPILRFPEVPSVDVVLIERPDFPYLGGGEVAQGPTGAAIANAVFDAIGVRLRDTPFTPARVRDALLAGATPAPRSA